MRKRIFYGVCMLGLVALMTTSCKKKEDAPNTTSATFGTIQAVDIDDDRAYLHPEFNTTYWDNEDAIKVFNFSNGQSAIYTVSEDGGGSNVATFVNEGDDLGYAPGYYAFYPAEMAHYDFDGEYQKFELKATQYVRVIGTQTSALQTISIPQAAYTTYEQNYYNFNLIFGVANFKVQCSPSPTNVDRYVKKIVVKDNHFNLWGEVTLKPNKIDQAKLTDMITYLRKGQDDDYNQLWTQYVISHEGDGLGYSSHGRGKELTYDFTSMNDGKGVMLNGNDTRNLMVGLRPGALAYGFTVDLYITDGEATKIIPIEKFSAENRKYGIRPGIMTGFNIGSITDLVDNYQQPQ